MKWHSEVDEEGNIFLKNFLIAWGNDQKQMRTRFLFVCFRKKNENDYHVFVRMILMDESFHIFIINQIIY